MPVSCDHLDRFLRAVHRRWIVVRLAESAGLAVLGGCGLALTLLPVLLWRGEPALPVVLMMIALAAAAGLVAGIIRRPGLLAAAAETDRQFDLEDLLSTAWITRGQSSADAWAEIVIATADARCRTLAPNAVAFNRLGGRAWGGIGLANALVLTLGLMSASPESNKALAAAGGEPISEWVAPSQAADVAAARSRSSAQQHRPPPRRPLNDRDERQEGPDLDAGRTTETAVQSDASPPRAAAEAAGSGAGLATSPRPSNAAAPRIAPAASAVPVNRNDDPDRQSAGGGRSSAARASVDDVATGSTALASPAAPVPAWQSSAWAADREEALSAVRDNRVPDGYRDLVRDYFEDRDE